jgi:hypothetical protein
MSFEDNRAVKRRRLAPALLLLLCAATVAWAADQVVVEDWTQAAAGARGIPQGWKGPKYDFTVAQDDGRKALHLKSANEGSTVSKEVKGKVDLKTTPVLEWSWKAVALPRGGDSRKKATDDQAAQVFVVWPRFPEAVRSRIIGYVWDTSAPVGTIVKSEKTGTVTYVVLRTGSAELGKWVTERRNVAEDFRKIYGEEPEPPAAVSIAIDSNDTNSVAESFIGPIVFKKS